MSSNKMYVCALFIKTLQPRPKNETTAIEMNIGQSDNHSNDRRFVPQYRPFIKYVRLVSAFTKLVYAFKSNKYILKLLIPHQCLHIFNLY